MILMTEYNKILTMVKDDQEMNGRQRNLWKEFMLLD